MSSNRSLKESITDVDSELPSTEGEEDSSTENEVQPKKFTIFIDIINNEIFLPPTVIGYYNKLGFFIHNLSDIIIKPKETVEIKTGFAYRIPYDGYFGTIKIYPVLKDMNIQLVSYYNDHDTNELILLFRNNGKLFEKGILKSQIIAELYIIKKINKKIHFDFNEYQP